MSYYSPSIEKLIEAFEKLPSIGNKTAARLAFYILNASQEETNEFVEAIVNAKKNLKYCSICYNISDTDPCAICSNAGRDKSVICVVEDVKDIVAMEKTHEFKGLYHVLHGSISPMNGIGPDDIKIKELLTRLGRNSKRSNFSNKSTSRRRSYSYLFIKIDKTTRNNSNKNSTWNSSWWRFRIYR